MDAITLVFVHGWSVTNLNTYGRLPDRLQAEAAQRGLQVSVKEIFLGRYISFHDDVQVADIARAFQTAVTEQLAGVTTFMCITHSTGGPVLRDWWDRYCKGRRPKTRLSHLIMLAPANFGSALAQLGKGTLSRLKSWWSGVEPGQGVLNWLTLGSSEAWNLNLDWIRSDGSQIVPSGVFPFVLTGQSIDRELYDAVNAYTGETGSDGVVRVAGANLNATYIRLEQPAPKVVGGNIVFEELAVAESADAPPVPLRVIHNKAHSGKDIGIMFSVGLKDAASAETVTAILDCMQVKTGKDYENLTTRFAAETEQVQRDEQVEIVQRYFLSDRVFIHDRYTMIIFKIRDSEGYPITDFDLVFTAGADNNPNLLPEGFLVDKQRNKRDLNAITYFLNYDVMTGAPPIMRPDGSVLRAALPGIEKLGIKITPRPDAGFVRYLECRYSASSDLVKKALTPNGTTMIEIVMQRIVDKEVFRLEGNTGAKDFSKQKPTGGPVE